MKKYDFSLLQHATANRWPDIIRHVVNCETINAMIDRLPVTYHAGCPVHGGMDGFRLFDDFDQTGGGICNTCNNGKGFSDGFALTAWRLGITRGEAVKRIAQYVGLSGDQSPHTPAKAPAIVTTNAFRKRDLSAQRKYWNAWNESVSGNSPEAELLRHYLKNRGLPEMVLPPSIRFHPRLPYFIKDEKASAKAKEPKYSLLGYFPAMIAKVEQPNGHMVTVHRTFLAEDGSDKAPVPKPKKKMKVSDRGQSSGAAVHLGSAARILHFCEGIETGLAIRAAKNESVWSILSNNQYPLVHIPESVELAVFWVDLDHSQAGFNPAMERHLALALQGRASVIMTPKGPIPEGKKGLDWLDMFIQYGPKAFPDIQLPAKAAELILAKAV